MPTFCRKLQVSSFIDMINLGNYNYNIMLTRFSERIFKIWNIRLLEEADAEAGSTLEIDAGHRNKKIGFYPMFLRPFLRISCVVDDSMYACRRNCSSACSQLFKYSD